MSLRNIFTRSIIASTASFIIMGQANAENYTLSCKLYNATSTADETVTKVELENSAQTLGASRTASFCLFSDGTIAEKQFVSVNRVQNEGATGLVLGISVYTLENGDSVTATFTGDWGSTGFVGAYQIIDGTGLFKKAKGDGSFIGAKSPWPTSQVFDVVLNVTTQ